MLVKLAAKQMWDQLARGPWLLAGVMRRFEPFSVVFSQTVDPIVQPVKRAVVGGHNQSVRCDIAKVLEAFQIEPQWISIGFIALQADIG